MAGRISRRRCRRAGSDGRRTRCPAASNHRRRTGAGAPAAARARADVDRGVRRRREARLQRESAWTLRVGGPRDDRGDTVQARYNDPDNNDLDEIATCHNVKRENVLLGAGSSEILDVVGRTLLPGGRKVIGVEPTFASVYEYASGVPASWWAARSRR